MKDIDQIAFARWYATQAGLSPSLEQAYIAGSNEGIAIGRRMAEMEDEMGSYTLTDAGRAHLEGK